MEEQSKLDIVSLNYTKDSGATYIATEMVAEQNIRWNNSRTASWNTNQLYCFGARLKWKQRRISGQLVGEKLSKRIFGSTKSSY